ncbi:MAG: hypothetical protein AB7U20_14045 [Planctomycetaceae bacterium]
MLVVSLFLAGLAIAISAVALGIAVSRDLRDRDRRLRTRLPAVHPSHAVHLVRGLQERRLLSTVQDGEVASGAGGVRAPDIIVGQWAAASEAPGSASRRRKAA